MARKIDTMDRDVTSWEADFLDSILSAIDQGKHLSGRQESKLREIYLKYFPEDEDILKTEDDAADELRDFLG